MTRQRHQIKIVRVTLMIDKRIADFLRLSTLNIRTNIFVNQEPTLKSCTSFLFSFILRYEMCIKGADKKNRKPECAQQIRLFKKGKASIYKHK